MISPFCLRTMSAAIVRQEIVPLFKTLALDLTDLCRTTYAQFGNG